MQNGLESDVVTNTGNIGHKMVSLHIKGKHHTKIGRSPSHPVVFWGSLLQGQLYYKCPSIFSLNFLSCCFIPKSDICLTLFQSRIAAGSENMSWESYFLLQVCNVIKCSSLFAGDIGSMIRICHFAVHQTRLWILHVFSFSNCTGSQKEFFLISLVLFRFLQITNLNIYALNFFFKFKVP